MGVRGGVVILMILVILSNEVGDDHTWDLGIILTKTIKLTPYAFFLMEAIDFIQFTLLKNQLMCISKYFYTPYALWFE